MVIYRASFRFLGMKYFTGMVFKIEFLLSVQEVMNYTICIFEILRA